MIYTVYRGKKNQDALLLTAGDMFVINGAWQIIEKDGAFFTPIDLDKPIDIELAGYIKINDNESHNYNHVLGRFEDGERAIFTKCESCQATKWKVEGNI